MAYTPTVWVENGPPGITAANLNKMENGIKEAHTVADGLLVEILELFVNASVGNDNNNGLSAGTAFRTINKAIQVASKYVAMEVRMTFAAGTYTLGAPISSIRANHIYFSARGADSAPILNVTGGEIDTANMYGQVLEFGYEWVINGYFSGNAGLILGNCAINTSYYSVDLTDSMCFVTDNCDFTGSGINLRKVGVVNIRDCSVTTTFPLHISMDNVGSANLNGVTFSTTNKDGLLLSGGSTAYLTNCSGTLGTGKFINCDGSIAIKGSGNSVTGAADDTSNGGQIFS